MRLFSRLVLPAGIGELVRPVRTGAARRASSLNGRVNVAPIEKWQAPIEARDRGRSRQLAKYGIGRIAIKESVSIGATERDGTAADSSCSLIDRRYCFR